MEDILERRQESYDETYFAFLQKTGKFEKNVLIFRLEGSKICICAKKHRGRMLLSKRSRERKEQTKMRKHFAKTMLMILVMLTVLFASAFSAAAESNVYAVSTDDELSTALQNIAAGTDTEATIVLKADVNAPVTAGESYTTTFGVGGKHITVKSDEGEMKKLSFPSYGVLTGDCTFDNVNVTGSRLFCNGYDTIFTENGQIHLSETLYGGGYKTTVNKTHVVIAASGYINLSSSSGLHDVIGGSYQGSVEGDSLR